MNSRFCHRLIVSALVITASGAWSQRSAPPASDQKSVAVIEQQAANGDATAQWFLGVRYEHGKGVPQDYAQAAAWYRKAAEQGDATAEWLLGGLYDLGHGVRAALRRG
jgi:TPR repeat protein